jgi:copper(I)-binding protein
MVMTLRNLAMVLFTAATLLSASVHAAGVMAMDGWIREAPPGVSALAGYMKLHNSGDKSRKLVGASSPAFGNIMLHRTMMVDGMAKMVHQPAVEIPPGGEVVFEPSGYHLMLMKPKHPLKAGDQVDITLEFADGGSVKVTHQVRKGEGSMEHGTMDHGHMGH